MFVKMNRELELQKVHHGRELILLFIFGSHCCMLWIDDVALNVSYIAARKKCSRSFACSWQYVGMVSKNEMMLLSISTNRLLNNTNSCRLICYCFPRECLSSSSVNELCFLCPNCISVLLYVGPPHLFLFQL